MISFRGTRSNLRGARCHASSTCDGKSAAVILRPANGIRASNQLGFPKRGREIFSPIGPLDLPSPNSLAWPTPIVCCRRPARKSPGTFRSNWSCSTHRPTHNIGGRRQRRAPGPRKCHCYCETPYRPSFPRSPIVCPRRSERCRS
jgi:hypothetical protein